MVPLECPIASQRSSTRQGAGSPPERPCGLHSRGACLGIDQVVQFATERQYGGDSIHLPSMVCGLSSIVPAEGVFRSTTDDAIG